MTKVGVQSLHIKLTLNIRFATIESKFKDFSNLYVYINLFILIAHSLYILHFNFNLKKGINKEVKKSSFKRHLSIDPQLSLVLDRFIWIQQNNRYSIRNHCCFHCLENGRGKFNSLLNKNEIGNSLIYLNVSLFYRNMNCSFTVYSMGDFLLNGLWCHCCCFLLMQSIIKLRGFFVPIRK